MKTLAALTTSLLAVTAFAQTPALPQDAKIDQVTSDLKSISRIATLAGSLSDTRQVMLAMIDNDVDAMREKRGDDTYRWASLQREEGGRVSDEKDIERVYTEKELREVRLTATNAYRLEVTLPTKRSLFGANNRVFIRNVIVDSTGFDGKAMHHEIPVNAWVNPGDSNGVPFPEIGKSVSAMVELGVEDGTKRAVAKVSLLQAKLVDDPTSPYFPAVKRLLEVRSLVTKDINRGQLKNMADEAVLAMPSELEKRAAMQAAAAEQRRMELAAGTMKGSIAPGDATNDVLAALRDVSHLLGGTLEEQAAARAKLQTLIDSLQPPVRQ